MPRTASPFRETAFANLPAETDAAARSGLFDLVLCRNVLIYFQPETKVQVVRGLLRNLTPDGYLFVGHSESLHHLTDCVRSIMPTIYVRSETRAAR